MATAKRLIEAAVCGILGIYHPRHAYDRGRVEELTQKLRHRGPDEGGLFSDTRVSMGIRRLSVIDLEGGSQPITNEDGTIHLAANCEIYDFERIRRELLARGHRLSTSGDAEVLLHLYEENELDLLEGVDGMFAFALWDSVRGRLVLGRDRFGIKPLFHTLPGNDGGLAFASELAPLLEIEGISRELDPEAIDDFFALSYIPHPRTAFRRIRKLPPSSLLIVDEHGMRTTRYWKLPESTVKDERHALESLDAAMGRAVTRTMRSDVPVGALLSGGLDSSSVVYHMAQLSTEPVQTFSLCYAEKNFDEGPLARLTAQHLGTQHREVRCSPEALRCAPRMMQHFGEPFADPSQIPTLLLCREAHGSVGVVLSGDGGDELLGGYRAYRASLLAKRHPRLLGILSHLAPFIPRVPRSPEAVMRFAQRLRKVLEWYDLPPAHMHAMWRAVMEPTLRRSIYREDFLDALGDGIERPLFRMSEELFEGRRPDEITGYQLLDLQTFMTDNNLVKVDRMSMATSLEVRIPYLDLEVVSAAFCLPAHLLITLTKTKIALRKLMASRLPRAVTRLPKRGFDIPLASWFRGPLRDMVRKTLAPDRVDALPVLSSRAVQDVVAAHLDGRRNSEKEIWSLMCFVHWHEWLKSL